MADLLLTARRNEHSAKFWKYAEEDEDDAPRAMKALIAGENSVPVTQGEADEALAWCDGRVGWVPRRVPTLEKLELPVAVLRRIS
jgi:hypothetical protein